MKKHKLPVTLLIICLFALLGFKDTGIFVNEYISTKEDGTQAVFNKEEVVEVLRENEDSYFILRDEVLYKIPKTNMIRTTRTSQTYKVVNPTVISDKPLGNIYRKLQQDELLQIEKIESDYGIFLTSDKVLGYVLLDDLERVEVESLSYGVSKVDKVIKNENLFYVLIKGEAVAVKNFKENKYIIIDENGNEFTVDSECIELKPFKEQVSRSSVSRRTSSITKVVSSAYNALGKPYVYGDIGRKGYDCSGLVYSVYLNNLGIKLPRSSSAQVQAGEKVERADLVPGDIVLFNTSGKGISHAGLYIGDGNMIHASSSQRKVMITSIYSTYYNSRFVTARRVIK